MRMSGKRDRRSVLRNESSRQLSLKHMRGISRPVIERIDQCYDKQGTGQGEIDNEDIGIVRIHSEIMVREVGVEIAMHAKVRFEEREIGIS
jgi:hypothetical protein